MFPAIRLKCTHCDYDVSLRQGVPRYAEAPAGEQPEHDSFMHADDEPLAAFEYDLLCLKCGRVEACDLAFDPCVSGSDGLRAYQHAIDHEKLTGPEGCEECSGQEFIHTSVLARRVNLHDIEPDPMDSQENIWWAIYDQILDFFEEVDHLYPHEGSPIPFAQGYMETPDKTITERFVSTLWSMVRQRTLENWSQHNFLRRRQRYNEFFRTLPKEFRNDFRLKQLYFLTADNAHAQERLLEEIQHRIHALEETSGYLLNRDHHAPGELGCPSCRVGYLVQRGIRMGLERNAV